MFTVFTYQFVVLPGVHDNECGFFSIYCQSPLIRQLCYS